MPRRTHGHASGYTRSPEYTVWQCMKTRCYRKAHNAYRFYGAKGIRVCKRWLNSFEAFFADMGPRPLGTQIDRWPNPKGNYTPRNCRWATSDEQHGNLANAIRLKFKGETKTPLQWQESLGIPRSTIYKRVRRGLPVRQILSVEKLYGRNK